MRHLNLGFLLTPLRAATAHYCRPAAATRRISTALAAQCRTTTPAARSSSAAAAGSSSSLSRRGFTVLSGTSRSSCVTPPSSVSCVSFLSYASCLSPLRDSQYLQFAWIAQRSLVEVKFRKANDKDTSNIPFKVMRTPSGNLPVYSRIRKHGTAVTTIIRHALGDISALKKDLLVICEAPVRERCGTLEVKGLHVLKIKQWLTHLGF